MSGTIKAGVLQHPDSVTENVTLNDDGSVSVSELNGRDPDNLVAGPASATDNALVRFDGTGGKTVQGSGITVDDSGNFTSDLTISKAAATVRLTSASGAAYLACNRVAGQIGGLRLETSGALRWLFAVNNASESGSNAGSDFVLGNYTDAGTSIGNVLSVQRSTGKFQLVNVGASAGLELGVSGPRVMSGTGSPEGVVTAPVGSMWTDEAATTGAIRWIKATGTGNTGWVVEYGDTGERNLAAESLSNSWAVANSAFRLRRVGQLVQMLGYFTNTSASADTIYTLPSGFRPSVPAAGSIDSVVPTSSSDDYCYGYISSGGVMVLYRACMTGATGYWTQSWFTTDTWPTSLPGSAA